MQVSNDQGCIKVACDFLTVEGVIESAKVAADFRNEQMPDILQLETILWNAWMSLDSLISDEQRCGPSLTRSQKKRKHGRETDRAKEDVKRRRKERKANVGQKCPHTHCVDKTRRFAQLNGLFAHMFMVHAHV